MDVEQAIRTRRTHKVFAPEPVPRELLDELFELARWAPNHHLTNPWRFRVLGPDSLQRLKQAAGPESAGKLDRAPTLVAVTASAPRTRPRTRRTCWRRQPPPMRCCWRRTDAASSGIGARPGVLRCEAGLAALGIGPDERFVALIHLGRPRQDKRAPERAPVAEIVEYLG